MFRLRYLLLLALAIYLLTGIAQVRPEERAVVRRFGEVVARPGPGLWVGFPWGIDRVDRVPVRTARQLKVGYDPATTDGTLTSPPGQLLTGDQNLVNVQIVLDYAVGESDADLDDYVLHRDRVDAVLGREAESLAAEWLAGRPVDEVLLTGNAALPGWLTARLPDRVTASKLGVRVQRVSVGYLAAPEEVRASFEAVNAAQTGIRTREHQARQESDRRQRQADAYRYRMEQEAEAYREEQLRIARAEADTFRERLEQYRRLHASNPDVLLAMWWEEMGRTLTQMKGRGRIDVIDGHLGKDGLDITQFVSPKK
jgi:membrane protease subunit HflK